MGGNRKREYYERLFKRFLREAAIAKKRARGYWKLLKGEFRDVFLFYSCDLLRFCDGTEIYYTVDSAELYTYIFKRIEPMSKVVEKTFDLLRSDDLRDKNFIFLPPYYSSELVITLAHSIRKFEPIVQQFHLKEKELLKKLEEIDNLIMEKRYPEASEMLNALLAELGGFQALKTILMVRDIRYRYGEDTPRARLEKFIDRYDPLTFEQLPVEIDDETLKSPPDYKKYLSLIDQIRPGFEWSNEIDAKAAALNIHLCRVCKAEGINCYFPIYTSSRVFREILWMDDPVHSKLSIQRRYISPLLYSYTLNTVHDAEIIEDMASNLRDLLTKYIRYELPPAGMLGYIKPLRPILNRVVSDFEDFKGVKIKIKDEPSYWSEAWIKSAMDMIRACITFIEEVEDIMEIEEEALKAIYELYTTLAPFMDEELAAQTLDKLDQILEGEEEKNAGERGENAK